MNQTTPTITNSLPTILVLFGVTGDLTHKKIIPALWRLFHSQQLPHLFQVIGYSHRPLNQADFRALIERSLREAGLLTPEIKNTLLDRFVLMFSYQSGDFTTLADYTELGRVLGHIDGEWRICANKLFYLAVPPHYLEPIVHNLARSGLTKPCNATEGWTRVLVEKPFGKDLATAEKLDKLLSKLFREEQIYRIDHYLAKEMLQNILAFRFSNSLFEKTWSRDSIEKIELHFWETAGAEERGVFYDGVGALRDVGQNHLLQMLALITMEQPRDLGASTIRQERGALLSALPRMKTSEIKTNTYRAQYAGYRGIKGVAPESSTETYFSITTELTTKRWQGVPIVIDGGKRLAEKRKEIVVSFKHTEPCLCPPGAPHHQNRIIFSLEPTEGITIQFWSKQPGLIFTTEERSLDFMLRKQTDATEALVTEHQKLLLDAIVGDQTLFNDTAEINAMWSFIDPIVSAWSKNMVPLNIYEPGTQQSAVASAKRLHENTTLGISKHIGVVGLGKMGANIARRLTDVGCKVTAFNRTYAVTEALAAEGSVRPTKTLQELAAALPTPRVVWLMVPAGAPVDEMLFGKDGLTTVLSKGDIIIDGGNSFYGDDAKRAKRLNTFGIHLMDVGTSGGPEGARRGPCLMIGGPEKIFKRLEPLFKDLAAPGGYAFFAGTGAGHFVKMVHNGIEYGMMQAIAEGMEVLKKSPFKLDLLKVAEIYNSGSVIASRLVGWLQSGYQEYGQDLKSISSTVSHTGEGAWTVETAKKMRVPVPIIEGSLKFRKQSAKKPSYTGRVLSMLRNQFGGHSIKND